MLVESLGLAGPIAVGNDGDLGALAEHIRGAGRGIANLVYLSGEVGLGAGIILDGRPLSGAGGYAGEVGHIRVNPRGRWCRCGRRGCWETEVGEEAIALAAGMAQDSSLDEVLAAYDAGDAAARRGLVKVGTWLGVGLADLVNIFNPQAVIFGGITQEIFQRVREPIAAGLAGALTAPRDQVCLLGPGLGPDSALLGAAELAFARLLDNPLAA
jgi:predicted NBD/HSP70 family sugar kinase